MNNGSLITRRKFVGAAGALAGTVTLAPIPVRAQAPPAGKPAQPASTITTPPRDWSPDANVGYKTLFGEGKADWRGIFHAAENGGAHGRNREKREIEHRHGRTNADIAVRFDVERIRPIPGNRRIPNSE